MRQPQPSTLAQNHPDHPRLQDLGLLQDGQDGESDFGFKHVIPHPTCSSPPTTSYAIYKCRDQISRDERNSRRVGGGNSISERKGVKAADKIPSLCYSQRFQFWCCRTVSSPLLSNPNLHILIIGRACLGHWSERILVQLRNKVDHLRVHSLFHTSC